MSSKVNSNVVRHVTVVPFLFLMSPVTGIANRVEVTIDFKATPIGGPLLFK